MIQTKQVEQLKLNVTNIHSFLVTENKRQKKLKLEKERLRLRRVDSLKQERKERRLEIKSSPLGKIAKGTQEAVTSGGSILDKILNFGGLLLAGILVNNLPGIINKVREIIDSIVNFLTPIQSGFNLIKGFFTGEIDQSQYDVDKKRVDDALANINGEGGLIDQLAEKAGPLEGLIKTLKPAIELIRNKIGGNKMVLAKKGGKEGVLNKETGVFTERQFTSAERKKYQEHKKQLGSDISRDEISDPPSPGGAFSESALIKALDDAGYTNKSERAMFLAQMAHETGNFIYDEEIHDGSNYEGRSDLGNTRPGDGVRYKGRGYIQITGRANYRTYGNLIGVDLENNPNLAKDPNIAARVAIEYWKKRVDRTAAQNGDVRTVTYNINGGYNGLADRQRKFKKYMNRMPQPKITPAPNNKCDQVKVINQPDPRKSNGSTTVALQRVNTTQVVPFMMPIPTQSRLSSASQPKLPSIWT